MNAWFLQTLEDVKRHEGCRLTAYWDPIGNCWTIGWGHTKGVLPNTRISQDVADDKLEDDLYSALADVRKLVKTFDNLDVVRKTVLLNMCFNMGLPTLSTFKKFLEAVATENWHNASLEMLNSRWAAQVKGRATQLAKRMQTGKLANG